MAKALSIDVFQGGYKPVPGGPGWDDSTAATWPATTSTLISGNSESLLVDALLTRSEGEQLAAWVRSSGRRLRAIFVTHGHADHFFGAGPVQEAWPDAALLACDQHVIDEARGQTTPKVMASWNTRFPGQLAEPPPAPTLVAHEFDLEGHAVLFHAIGGADGVLATIAHVPELHTICSGDIVYNNIHMWLWNSTPESRKTWLASLDAVAALEPATIITGHKDPDAPDNDASRVLDQSRRYIGDFDQAVTRCANPGELIAAMLAKYPTYGNRYTLFLAASTQFSS